MKVYLSPSDQKNNKYAYGNTTEKEQCEKIATALAKHLKRCGITPVYDFSKSMQQRCKQSDDEHCDLYIPIHTNAYNGSVSGTRIFCYSRTGNGYKAANAIYSKLSPITPGKSESVTVNTTLYEVKVPSAPTAYIEVDFHDVKTVAKWITENTDEIAVAICKGICTYCKIDYVPEKKTDVLYKVQVGAYKDKKNAEATVKKLKEAGFTGVIVKE